MRLAPATVTPTGTPDASVTTLRLTPRLPRSVGLGPLFFPHAGQWGFRHAAINTQVTPIQAAQLIIEQDEPLDALMEVMRCNIINDEYGFAAELIRTYGELK